MTVEDFTKPDTVFFMGRPPARIDLLTDISGVTFDEAWATKSTFKLGESSIFVLSLPMLAKNKLATGRPKDLADLAWIEKQLDRSGG